MSDGAHIEMVRRRFEELDRGNFEVLDELFSPDYQLHPGGGAKPLDLDETKKLYRYLYDLFPGLRHTLDEQFAAGDKVVTRWTAQGGDVTFSGINIYTIDDGRFVRSDVSWDLRPALSLFDRARGTGPA